MKTNKTKKVTYRNLMIDLPEDVMMRLVKLAKQEQYTVHEMAENILMDRLDPTVA